MNVKIFQVNIDRDTNRAVFLSSTRLARMGLEINPEIYDLVFEGSTDCRDAEDVYFVFNMNPPTGYAGRSVSVSDVVAIQDPETGEWQYNYCDSIGYSQIEFDETKAVRRV